MNRATVVRELSPDPCVKQLLVKLEPPYEGHEYVVASASNKPFLSRPEVLVFPAMEDGTILDWMELAGCRDTLEHALPLMDMGYSLHKA